MKLIFSYFHHRHQICLVFPTLLSRFTALDRPLTHLQPFDWVKTSEREETEESIHGSIVQKARSPFLEIFSHNMNWKSAREKRNWRSCTHRVCGCALKGEEQRGEEIRRERERERESETHLTFFSFPSPIVFSYFFLLSPLVSFSAQWEKNCKTKKKQRGMEICCLFSS